MVSSAPASLQVGVVTYRSDPTHLLESLRGLFTALGVAERSQGLRASVTLVINDVEPARVDEIQSVADAVRQAYGNKYPLIVKTGHGNVGYASGQNLALNQCRADYFLVLNPDLEMAPDSVAACLDYLQSHDAVSMVVPQGYDPSGNYARLAKRYPSFLVLLLRWFGITPSESAAGRSVGRYVYEDCLPTNQPTEVDLASGCFMFCRASVWNEIAGFDERYFLYFEDYDLSIRIKEHGAIIELPAVKVVHHGGGTARFKPRRLVLFCMSALRFFNKHDWKWF